MPSPSPTRGLGEILDRLPDRSALAFLDWHAAEVRSAAASLAASARAQQARLSTQQKDKQP